MSKKIRTLKDDERLYNKLLNIATVILAIVSVGVAVVLVFSPPHW